MSKLSNVEQLVRMTPEGDQLIRLSVWVPPRLIARWREQMPDRSLSWFIRSTMENLLREMADLPKDALERTCRLLITDLSNKRVGPILRRRPRL